MLYMYIVLILFLLLCFIMTCTLYTSQYRSISNVTNIIYQENIEKYRITLSNQLKIPLLFTVYNVLYRVVVLVFVTNDEGVWPHTNACNKH